MSNTMKYILIILTFVAIIALAFGTGYNMGKVPAGSGGGLEVVQEAWDVIFRDYVDRDQLEPHELSRGAIEGMIEALDDPYSSYLEPETYEIGLSGLEGEIEGIGAQVGMREEKLTIISPIPDSPADQAGLKPDDIVLEIEGESTSGMSMVEAVLKIRGPKGTTVTLLIQHKDEAEPVEVSIVRATIELSSVMVEMMGDIARLRITHFSKRTATELEAKLSEIEQVKVRAIILDLRGNPGGILETVIEVTSQFLKEGVVLKVVDNRGDQTVFEVRHKEIVSELPMVVLVNEFSASGSEVLAGALQDHGRATIAGTRTYGKGSVNVPRQLQDGSGLYITTARWLTPNGRRIEGEGIEPDIQLELEGEEAIQWAIDYLESKVPHSLLWGITRRGATPHQITDEAAFILPASWRVFSGDFYKQ
ncbi:MAG TPA: S41 family peptidase [Dehalococcoidales bacterium]|nr:S41 family peptidase [Dehalococcoidales bacterium]